MNKTDSCYIHIPFCIKKCAYCDFYSVEDLSYRSKYIEALLKEIRLKGESGTQSSRLDTVYFGGGTPSVMPVNHIEDILSELDKNFKISRGAEITMEVNPGTIDREYLVNLKKSGINRLNIGVQSFRDENLQSLGRIHSAREAEKAVEYSQNSGFNNTGVDLIYGLPGQSADLWLKDLDRALSFGLQHLSCYMLTFEKNTPLYRDAMLGRIEPPSKESLASLFLKTSGFLTQNRFIHYEISNFASDIKTKSRHNLKYWNQTPYMGFGASAHSYDVKTRFWNHADIKKYIADLENDRLPVAERETLTKTQKTIEMIMLGLRTMDGIQINMLGSQFDDIVNGLEKDRLGSIKDEKFHLTKKGMCYLDSIIQIFVDNI